MFLSRYRFIINHHTTMKIETVLKIDERRQRPYWSSQLVYDNDNNNKVLLEVVSQTFDFKDFNGFCSNFERCNNRMLKEILKRKDLSAVRLLLINQTEKQS
jgi:hypothetical protein